MIVLDYIRQGIAAAASKVHQDIARVTSCPIYAHYPGLKKQKLETLDLELKQVSWMGVQFGMSPV